MNDRKIMRGLGSAFTARFGRSPAVIANSPGRVNLIGEHTDYCGGLVLPFASDLSLGVAAAPRGDGTLRIFYEDTGEAEEFSPDGLAPTPSTRRSYARGVAWSLLEEGLEPRGMDAVVKGDLPVGAGLSSSAALETGLCLCMEECSGFSLGPRRRAEICLRAERRWVGVDCGMMDQYACSLGREGHALLIDCASGDVRPVPLRTAGLCLVICDSRTRRRLDSGGYNLRRRECDEGLRILASRLPDKARLPRFDDEVDPELLEEIPHPQGLRVSHFLSENRRVREAVALLEAGKAQELGPLLTSSHSSLSRQMQVSTPELDFLVETAVGAGGALGSRLHGGGFGGCTLNLVSEDGLDRFVRAVTEAYLSSFGMRPLFHLVRPSEGARIVEAG